VYVCVCVNVCVCVCVRARTRASTRLCMSAFVGACAYIYMCACTQV
jgi:hypothetical protein